MKVLHKIFLFLCRVFTALCKKRRDIIIDVDNDGQADIKIEIGQNSNNQDKGDDENENAKLL